MVEKLEPRHRSRADLYAERKLADEREPNESPSSGDPRQEDYSVGYKKPPKEHQFRPGQSGNPKGRPKGSRNLKTELEEELQELIRVNESGTRRTVSKQRAVLKSLTARAAQGDTRAANVLLNLVIRLLTPDVSDEDDDDLTKEDLAILESFKSRKYTRSLRKKMETEP